MWIAVAIAIVVVIVLLYKRRKSDVVALPSSGLTEDLSVEPGVFDEITLEGIGAKRDRETMGAATTGGRRSRVHFDDGPASPDAEKFGTELASRCAPQSRGANPLIAAARSTSSEPCHFKSFYQYDEPCALYDRR